MANNSSSALGKLIQFEDLSRDLLLAALDPFESFDSEV